MPPETKPKLEPALTQAERYGLAFKFLITKEHPLLQKEIAAKNFKHDAEFMAKVVALAESETTEASQLLYAFRAKLLADSKVEKPSAPSAETVINPS